MSRVWFVIPSKRPLVEANKSLDKWRERGYRLALWRDEGDDLHPQCDLLMVSSPYPGWGGSVNVLGRMVLERDPECNWIVTGGDDTYPDPTHDPADIARECEERFGGTLGTMQPCGDPWGEENRYYQQHFTKPRHIERIAGSPWIGREYFLQANMGDGPIWAEYRAMYDDQELQEVATKQGLFWQRRDLTHYHDHWTRKNEPFPEFSRYWNSPAHFESNRALFNRRKAAGFPGSELLPA